MEVIIATKKEFKKLIPALLELRPYRTREELLQLLSSAYKEGFRVAYVGDETKAFAIIGFRILHFTYSKKTLYIDDFGTLASHRKSGLGKLLFDWIKEYARQQQCDHLSLDSGFQRTDAYRFYLNQGLFVECMHFGRKVIELT